MDAAEAAEILLAPPTDREPGEAYAALHAHGPVLRASDSLYLVSGYEAVDRALRDPATEAVDSARLDAAWKDWREYRAVALFANSMLRANPPHHTRQRRLAAGVFTARKVTALRATIAEQVDELLDWLSAYGDGADLVRQLAYPLPIWVITALLGVPVEDRGRFRRLAEALTGVLELHWTEADRVKADAAADELIDYFAQLVERRRTDPQDDLVTALAAAHDADGERLSGEELLANLALLLVAGFETTTNLIANGVDRCPADGGRRGARAGRQRAVPAARRGQPGSGAVRGAGRLRPGVGASVAAVVRGRRALLPRCPAGPAGGAGGAARAVAALPGTEP